MTTQSPPLLSFWNFLLQAAESLEACDDAALREAAMTQLVTLQEGFGELADPVDHFEAYVVLTLGAQLERALRLPPGP